MERISGARTAGRAALTALLLSLAAAAAAAETPGSDAAPPAERSEDERIDDIEETVQVLVEEIDSLRKIFAVPEEGGLQSYSGLGPAASKVYQRDRGLSIGGYGEVRFRGQVAERDGSQDIFDALRLILYAGYKFNDWIVFNSEIEFEHGGNEVSVEFLTLDFLLHEAANVRAGLVLLPMGFINEIHEPVFFFGNERPEVERRLIPSTWRENGAGLYGSLLDDRVQYRVYGVNGFDASGFSDNGFRGGRQSGAEALSDNFAFVGRLDVTPIQGLLLGGSVYYGKSGQNVDLTPGVPGGAVPSAATTIWEVHGQLQRYGAHVRGIYSESLLEDSAELSAVLGDTIARRMNGGYIEFAYDLLPLFLPDTSMSLEPFYRYERLNTQRAVTSAAGAANPDRDRRYHVVGLQYKPHPQVVLKVDYRDIDSAGTDLPDEIQVGFGFVF
jgi:hypothetical protein